MILDDQPVDEQDCSDSPTLHTSGRQPVRSWKRIGIGIITGFLVACLALFVAILVGPPHEADIDGIGGFATAIAGIIIAVVGSVMGGLIACIRQVR